MSIARIQLRRGTALQWSSSSNVVLAAGEIGFETDTNNFKIGDGIKTWLQLPYFKNVEKLNDVTENNLSNYAKSTDLQNYVLTNKIGNANGVASLDANGQVPLSQLQTIITGADESLNTLNEIAQALSDDNTGLDAILQAISGKVSKSGDTISGNLTIETGTGTNPGSGQVTANSLRLLSTGEADGTSTTHALQIGADNATKLKFDQNEIQALTSNNDANILSLNPLGGVTSFGGNVQINGTIKNSNGTTPLTVENGISTSSNIEVLSAGTFSGSGANLTNIPLAGLASNSRDTLATANTLVQRDVNGAFSASGINLVQSSISYPINPVRTFILDSNRVLTNNTTSQSIFNVGTTLNANTRYLVEMFVAFTKSGTSSVIDFQLTGSGTLALSNSLINTRVIAVAVNGTSTSALEKWLQITSPSTQYTVLSGGSTATGHFLEVKGLVSVSAAGTLNPFLRFATAVSPTILSGSYIRVTEVFGTTTGAWA